MGIMGETKSTGRQRGQRKAFIRKWGEPPIKDREGDTRRKGGAIVGPVHGKTKNNSKETETAGNGMEWGREGISVPEHRKPSAPRQVLLSTFREEPGWTKERARGIPSAHQLG